MQCFFREKFLKDLSKIRDKKVLKAIKTSILNTEAVPTLNNIKHIKKLKNYDNAFRIRVGDYRIGIFIEENIVEFVRVLHRKEVYRYFP